MTVRALPDTEGIIVAYLSGHPDVDISDNVSTDLPEGHNAYHLTIRRIGGRPRPEPHWIDQAHIELAAWGVDPAEDALTRDTTFDLCATALAALHELPGITALGIVTDVEDILGPRNVPDPVTSWPRYIAEVLVTTHPDPNAGS